MFVSLRGMNFNHLQISHFFFRYDFLENQ